VGGGIPCIKALKEGIAANNITYAAGIMNGAHDSLSLSLSFSPNRVNNWTATQPVARWALRHV
jgi:hypothetical protein